MRFVRPTPNEMRPLAALSASSDGQVLVSLLTKEMDGEIDKALDAARNQTVDLVAEARGMARASAIADVLKLLRDAQVYIRSGG